MHQRNKDVKTIGKKLLFLGAALLSGALISLKVKSSFPEDSSNRLAPVDGRPRPSASLTDHQTLRPVNKTNLSSHPKSVLLPQVAHRKCEDLKDRLYPFGDEEQIKQFSSHVSREHISYRPRSEEPWAKDDLCGIGTLSLLLADGTKLRIEDRLSEQADESVFHSFVSYLAEAQLYVIDYYFNELSGTMFVSAKDGHQSFLKEGAKIISPNGKKILSHASDLENDFSFNGMEISRIEHGEATQEFIFEPKDWSPTQVVWQDDDTVVFVQTARNAEERLSCVKFVNGTWNLVIGDGDVLPSACL